MATAGHEMKNILFLFFKPTDPEKVIWRSVESFGMPSTQQLPIKIAVVRWMTTLFKDN